MKTRFCLRFLLAAFVFVFSLAFASAASSSTTMSVSTAFSNPQYYSPSNYQSYSYQKAADYWPALANPDTCQAGKTDFLMIVRPGSCTPRVVRSDLLEEQNVPIFCKVDIVKINPIIDITQIKSVKFDRKSGGDYVAGVSFHPNREAIYSQKGYLDNPLINNVGYVVILIKRIPTEKEMPDSIKLNVTGVLSYDSSGFFGSGKDAFYLKVESDANWSLGDNYKENAFFRGNGYLRAEEIDSDRARIAIYRDKDTKLASFVIKKGETSAMYYMPGFYCKAGVQLRLDDINAGVKRVQLRVDDNQMWLTEGESFLDNKCKVTSISVTPEGKVTDLQHVSFWKEMDETSFSSLTFGDVLNGEVKTPFVAVVRDSAGSEEERNITSVSKAGREEKSLSGTIEKYDVVELVSSDKSGSRKVIEGRLEAKVSDPLKTDGAVSSKKVMKIKTPEYQEGQQKKSVTISCKGGKSETLFYTEGQNKSYEKKTLEQQEKEGLVDADIDDYTKKAFNLARQESENIEKFYGAAGDARGIWAANSIYQLALLAESAGLKKTARDLFSKLVQDYPQTPYSKGASLHLTSLGVSSTSYKNTEIELLKIEAPTRQDASADFTVKKNGGVIEKSGTKGVQVGESFALNTFKMASLSSTEVKLTASYTEYDSNSSKTKKVQKDIVLGEEKTRDVAGDYEIVLNKINFNKVAKVSVISVMSPDYSESNFPVEIGIEKRGIKLSPEKIRDMIKNLNKTIESWEKITENLGKVVSTMKGACLTTSALLTVKNLFANFGGGATARQAVMKQWYEQCRVEAGNDKNAFNQCLNKHSGEIEKDVSTYQAELEKLNNEMIDVQKANLVPGTEDTVNRKKATETFRNKYLNSDVTYETYKFDEQTGEITKTTSMLTLAQIQQASLTDLRDIEFSRRLLNSGASDATKRTASMKIDSIAARLKQKEVFGANQNLTGINRLYDSKNGQAWVNNIPLNYYTTGKNIKLAHIVPLAGKEYESRTGFYVAVDEPDPSVLDRVGGYKASGELRQFRILNVGADGQPDLLGDEQITINLDTLVNNRKIQVLGLNEQNSKKIIEDAQQAVAQANLQYGNKKVNIFGTELLVEIAKNPNERRCQDFMSPQDCQILFNVCDPVVCPSSRCDLGGAYRVDNVIQSGIIGSIALCLPNYKEGIMIPICLSGVHAGLQAFVSILKAHRDCLQEQLDSGRLVGICDEIQSLYLCEFFWRQIGPFMDILIQKVIESGYGQGMRGGGEYLTVRDSWDNMQKSIDFMKNEYSANAYKVFEARNLGEVGVSFCKMFISASAPKFKALLEPDSPVQYAAWFDEIPYTEATAPATSQYKVFYHIYSGTSDVATVTEGGVYYQVYLKSPPQTAYTPLQEVVIVDTGFIPRGGYASQTRDFTAPAGYQQLCVRINGKDDCGFKKVSTDFGLNYISDKYYEEQLSRTDIRTSKECISGSPSVAGFLQSPNLQEGAENAINPQLETKGVVRVCSTTNPGESTKPQRWKEVGYCDNEDVKCWIDIESVQNVIKNKNIQNATLTQINNLTNQIDQPSFMDEERISQIFSLAKESIARFDEESSVLGPSERRQLATSTLESKKTDIMNVMDLISALKGIEDKAAMDNIKAEAVFYRFKIYHSITKALVSASKELKEGEDYSYYELPDGSIIQDNSFQFWTRKGDKWYKSDASGSVQTGVSGVAYTSIKGSHYVGRVEGIGGVVPADPAGAPATTPKTTTETPTVWADNILKKDVMIYVRDDAGAKEKSYMFKSARNIWVSFDGTDSQLTGKNYVDGIMVLVKKTNSARGESRSSDSDYIRIGQEKVENLYSDSDEQMAEKVYKILNALMKNELTVPEETEPKPSGTSGEITTSGKQSVLSQGDSMSFSFESRDYTITVDSIDEQYGMVEMSLSNRDKITLDLEVASSVDWDLDKDGDDDVSIELLDVQDNQATLKVSRISALPVTTIT
jgi:hypothetical protein